MLRTKRCLLLLLALALPFSLVAQETRVVTGVVIDDQSRAPVADVLVTIQGTDLRAVTDAQGRFSVADVPVGSRQLVVRHVAYGEHAQAVSVGAEGPLDFQIRISSRAIALTPMVVRVTSPDEQARRASGTVTNIIDRETIDAFASTGQGMLPLLAARIPSLRVIGSCVEYRLQLYLAPSVADDPSTPDTTSSLACRDITVYVDGIPSNEGTAVLESLSPRDVERIQLLTPGEAGARYPNAGRGVILVQTRQGVAPVNPEQRVNVNGFAWNEPRPYRLLRVLLVSAAGSAAVSAVVSKRFDSCTNDALITPVHCHAVAGTAAGVATSAVGAWLARKAGKTDISEGRTVPGLLLGTATATVGYVLYMHGVTEDSSASRTAGRIVLAVGMPVTLTLADRALRVLR